jgi:uncharacterized protein (DUF433 family)
MTTHQYRIVSADESNIHAEPHIRGSRVTVRDVLARVEQRRLSPELVAERYNLDTEAIYAAIEYYHRHPKEMRRVEERHDRAKSEARERSSIVPPDSY